MLMIGMAVAWPSPVLPLIMNRTAPVRMNNAEVSWMVSLMFLGNTISPIPSGWLMDKLGRKKIMYILNVCPFTAWIITYFSTQPWHLYIARFLNGLWAGTAYTVCAIYIGEIAEPSIRGSLSNFNNLLKTFGGLLVFIVGPYVSYEVLALVCGLVPAIYFVAAAFIPESPYFLMAKNRKSEAKEALRWLRGNKENVALESELTHIEKTVTAQTQTKATLKDIFTDRANRKGFIITFVLSLVKNLTGYDVMMAYTSITLPQAAFEHLGPNECVIILGVISVVTCIGTIFILDRFPRRVLLSISSLGCALTTFLAGGWFFLNSSTNLNVESLAQVPFYCLAVHAVVYSIGLGPIVASVKGEMFSANVKALCSAITSLTFAIITFIQTKIYLLIADTIGMYLNYFIYGLGCTLGTVFIITYAVETRGKSLYEIQVKLSERKKTTKGSSTK